jgi:predicted GIY-YIG superfamily endonuclease|uniref:CCHC-type domain-containing protein n=1 Tax=Phaeodactylum tricornutum TaxID=2850 RepID=A0A8J9S0N9_PHATR
MPNSYTIYTLSLEGGCYYVGSTSRTMSERFQEHQAGTGSSWTRLHPPIKIRKSYRYHGPSPGLEEDREVYELMKDVGIDKVRGGQFVQLIFTEETKRSLQRTLRHSVGACMRCGRQGHVILACRAVTDLYGTVIPRPNETNRSTHKSEVRSTITQKPRARTVNSKTCARCGRSSHDENRCYATTHSSGRVLESEEDEMEAMPRRAVAQKPRARTVDSKTCARCGRSTHDESRCYATTHSSGRVLESEEDEMEAMPRRAVAQKPRARTVNSKTCARCGRSTHDESRCYATTHSSGRVLESEEDESDDEDFFCSRCGRSGHDAEECYARSDANGRRLW